MSRELWRAMTAEAIGTFALVFAGCGAIMVDAKTHQLGHVGVAITFGLVIMFVANAYRQAGAHAVEGFRKVLLGIIADDDDRRRFLLCSHDE